MEEYIKYVISLLLLTADLRPVITVSVCCNRRTFLRIVPKLTLLSSRPEPVYLSTIK